MITTRLASPEDRAPAIEVWRLSRAAQGRRPNADVIAGVTAKAENGLLLVAEEDTELAAMALGERSHDDPELLHLEMVIVHPDRRGQGLGPVLVEAMADVAWERGYRRAEVWCTAPGFYEACGFERSGKQRDDSVHLTAELEPAVRSVTFQGEIRLGQLLKLAEMVDTGAEGKAVIAAGQVLVNDEIETRRGRQMADGDVVRANNQAVRLTQG